MRSIRLRRALPWIAAACLTSCAGANSSGPVPAPCGALVLRTYSAAEQHQVADEIDAAPGSAAWPGFVRDYGTLRAEARACRGVK